jgi:hypothetical protein
MENMVIEKFKAYLFKNYKDPFFYKVHSDGYGNKGIPDLIVKIPEFHPRVFFIEAKEAESLDKALDKLRPAQKGMIHLMEKSCTEVYILYGTKNVFHLAKKINKEWVNFENPKEAFYETRN